MRYIICLCCLSMLIQGCQNHVENKPIPQNAQVVKDTPSNKGNEKATIDTKAFGDKVLKGLVTVSDDELTFACMDSLTSNNAQTRSFYWEVFKVILKQSDGALSEVVGANAYAFLQKYPLSL
jgi:hypothetical protein